MRKNNWIKNKITKIAPSPYFPLNHGEEMPEKENIFKVKLSFRFSSLRLHCSKQFARLLNLTLIAYLLICVCLRFDWAISISRCGTAINNRRCCKYPTPIAKLLETGPLGILYRCWYLKHRFYLQSKILTKKVSRVTCNSLINYVQ